MHLFSLLSSNVYLFSTTQTTVTACETMAASQVSYRSSPQVCLRFDHSALISWVISTSTSPFALDPRQTHSYLNDSTLVEGRQDRPQKKVFHLFPRLVLGPLLPRVCLRGFRWVSGSVWEHPRWATSSLNNISSELLSRIPYLNKRLHDAKM